MHTCASVAICCPVKAEHGARSHEHRLVQLGRQASTEAGMTVSFAASQAHNPSPQPNQGLTMSGLSQLAWDQRPISSQNSRCMLKANCSQG